MGLRAIQDTVAGVLNDPVTVMDIPQSGASA
jgi:hypothetical protein